MVIAISLEDTKTGFSEVTYAELDAVVTVLLRFLEPLYMPGRTSCLEIMTCFGVGQ